MADGALGQERGVGPFEDVYGMAHGHALWVLSCCFLHEMMVSIRLWFLRTCSCHSFSFLL